MAAVAQLPCPSVPVRRVVLATLMAAGNLALSPNAAQASHQGPSRTPLPEYCITTPSTPGAGPTGGMVVTVRPTPSETSTTTSTSTSTSTSGSASRAGTGTGSGNASAAADGPSTPTPTVRGTTPPLSTARATGATPPPSVLGRRVVDAPRPTGKLAFTGLEVAVLLALAAALVVVGLVLRRLARHRRPRRG